MRCGKIIGFLVLSMSLVSCSLFKSSGNNSIRRLVDTDSSAVIYNDSVDAIIFHSEKVRLYDMADFVSLSDSVEVSHDSIFNYAVGNSKRWLNREELNVVHFIISDKDWYVRNYSPIRQPFNPNMGMEFIYGKSKAYMFVSFGTEEVAIATLNGKFKFYKMHDKRPMARWATLVFPNNDYYKKLL